MHAKDHARTRRPGGNRPSLERLDARKLLALVTWDGGGDGINWNTAANWSNDAHPGSADDVVIDIAANPSIVLMGTAPTIRSLVSSESLRIAASLTITADATFNAPTGVVGARALTIRGTSVLNSVLTLGNASDSSLGILAIGGGVDQTLTGTGSITTAGTGRSVIRNATQALETGDGRTLTIGPDIEITGNRLDILAANPSGRVVLTGPLSTIGTSPSFTLGSASTWFDNDGSIALIGGNTISYNLTNRATRSISLSNNNTQLQLIDDVLAGGKKWINEGVINLGNNTFLGLGGFFDLADYGVVNRTGSNTVKIEGTLDLASTPLVLDDSRGSWTLVSGGKLRNGTVSRTGAHKLQLRGGTLDGVTLDTPAQLSGGTSTSIDNGLVLNEVLTIGSAVDNSSGTILFAGSVHQSLTGTGSIVLEGAGYAALVNDMRGAAAGSGTTATIGSDIEITSSRMTFTVNHSGGAFQNDGQLFAVGTGTSGQWTLGSSTSRRFINNGAITATAGVTLVSTNLDNLPGRTISLTNSTLELNESSATSAGGWDNDGVIQATASTVRFGGAFALTNVGVFNRDAATTASVNGTLDLFGQSWLLDDFAGAWTLMNNGRIKNGAIAGTGGSSLRTVGGTLDGITLNLPVRVSEQNALSIENGLVLNDVLTLGASNNSAGGLNFVGAADQSISGTGEIRSQGSGVHSFGHFSSAGGSATVTFGSDIEIYVSKAEAYVERGAFVNQGLIRLEQATDAWVIRGNGTNGTFHNNGRIEIQNGTFELGTTWTSTGTIAFNAGLLKLGGAFTQAAFSRITRLGGVIQVTGTLELAGQTLLLDDSTGSIGLLSGGVIRNGSVDAVGSYELLVLGGELDRATLSLPVRVHSGWYLAFRGGLVVNDTITLGNELDNTAGELRAVGNGHQMIGGTGQIVAVGNGMSTLANNLIAASSRTLTLGSDLEFTGKYARITTDGNANRVHIAGTIGSTVAGGRFELAAPTSFAYITISGTIVAENGGDTLVNNLFGNAGTLRVAGAGSFLDVYGVAYDLNRSPVLADDGVLRLRGSWTRSATIDVGGGAIFVDYDSDNPSPQSELTDAVRSAYASGTWTGAGITSSIAAANPAYAVGIVRSFDLFGAIAGQYLGLQVDINTILLRTVLRGDTNLNATVDFDDLLKLAQNYGGSEKAWIQADFNYDGSVNFDDLLPLAQNYGASGLGGIATKPSRASTSRKLGIFGDETI